METSRFNIIAAGTCCFAALAWMTVTEAAPRVEAEITQRAEQIAEDGQDLAWTAAAVEGQDITLRGYVPDSRAYQRAESMAAAIPGAGKIENEILLAGRHNDCQGRLDTMLTYERVQFEPDRDVISENSHFLLKMVAEVLRNCEDDVRIDAHTADGGSRGSEQVLSDLRATAVRSYLTRHGVDPDMLSTVGHGSSVPIYDNESEQGRLGNQRVEFVVLEKNS
ncbi:MAG: OmpA family protein [Pseudomonadota bacterium]